MATTDGFLDMLRDQLAGLGPVTIRRMFSGAGLYLDGAMFALVAGDVLYFKADAKTKAVFEAEGLGPFVYQGRSKPVAMSYWRAPERVYDDPEEMIAFARVAAGVARRAQTSRSTTSRRDTIRANKPRRAAKLPSKDKR